MNAFRVKTISAFIAGFSGMWLAHALLPPAYAEILVPPTSRNQLSVVVQPEVTKDPNTQIYTYSYSVSNSQASLQEMWLFAVEFAPATEIFNAVSPPGWRFGVHKDQPLASWAAVDIGELPPDYVDDGNVVPSPFNVKPGETLGGFSFQTFAAPSDGRFYAQGFARLPQVSVDAEELAEAGYALPPLTADSYTDVTATPTTLPYGGGRRPAVDGFLVFLNLQRDGNVFISPATIVTKFAAGGETVYRSTFRATLNQIDVTGLFVSDTTYGGDLVAQFSFTNSPLKQGRNVLITSVEGIVPDTTRTASDVDRVTFDVQN